VPEGGLGIIDEFKLHDGPHRQAAQGDLCPEPLTFGSRIHPGSGVQGHLVDIAERFCESYQRGAEGGWSPPGARGSSRLTKRLPRQRLGAEVPPLQPRRPRRRQREARVPHLQLPATASGRGASSGSTPTASPGYRRRTPTSSCWVRLPRGCPRSRRSANRLSDGREGLPAPGLIDVKNFYTDTPEDVAKRCPHGVEARQARSSSGSNPDCGFGWSPRHMCNQAHRGAGSSELYSSPQTAQRVGPEGTDGTRRNLAVGAARGACWICSPKPSCTGGTLGYFRLP
jgi:hypothetical protein